MKQKAAAGWTEFFDTLIKSIDESDPEQCRDAFEKCVEFANTHMQNDMEYNRFLAEAADRLGQERLHLDVIKAMVNIPDKARLNLVFEDGQGPVITGNREGLKYLSQVMQLLADSPLCGEHTHLYWDEPPFVGETFGVVIYLEDDEWFDGSCEDPDEEFLESDDMVFPRNIINPERIFAVQFLVDNPISMAIRPKRIYIVNEIKKFSSEEMWAKPIRDDDSRMRVFNIKNDRGDGIEIALDLDDPDVMFLTRDDVEQFLVS